MNDYFIKGAVNIGGKDVEFEKRGIRGGFMMYVPKSFSEDKTVVSNYSYLFSKDKSPLSIAVKFSTFTPAVSRERMIKNYFSGSSETPFTEDEIAEKGLHYRETVTKGEHMNVYSLRFSVDVEGGLLFGCFNCAADYSEDWKPAVVEMLRNIEAA